MKLSVVIVNYNVEYFLEQCLNSCLAATKNVSAEIFVVDNCSVDGSVEMVKKKFPNVKLIANDTNFGFSKANNQAIKESKGEYVLLLNPDTVVEEDTFDKVIQFMDEHPDAGGLGVKMVDGKGVFLPESKRGLPTPSVAFYKIFGLSKLFPKSKRFGKYHLGYLSEEEVHEIDVLSGAFMMMRKESLDEVGLLDEAFFMYGEDIDLSYRIQKGGWKNYYFPHTRIIHYKGESTKKSSVNYVFVFYRAMVIFAQKHFSKKNAKLFGTLINLAIYFRASLALLNRFIKKSFLPLLDMLSMLGGFLLIAHFYQKIREIEFPEAVLYWFLPALSITYFISLFYSGAYDKPIKVKNVFKGTFIALGIALMVYALLPKDVQFSRFFILISGAWSLIIVLVIRLLLHLSGSEQYSFSGNKNKRFIIVGKEEEAERVAGILKQTQPKISYLAFVYPEAAPPSHYLGEISRLREITEVYKIDEIIFCAQDTSTREIIQWMSNIDTSKTDFKIAQPESLFIIGSNSIETSGDLYVLDVNSISKSSNIRNKRSFDFFLSFFMILLLPVVIVLLKNPLRGISTLFENISR
jgi:GT2 family glycosyltransferase